MGTIKWNGNTITVPDGANVSIQGDNIIVNGSSVQEGVTGDVIIEGNVHDLNTDRSAKVHGDVTGNVKASDSVKCGNIEGSCSASGSVKCSDIGGDTKAGGSVKASAISGSVSAGGSIKV